MTTPIIGIDASRVIGPRLSGTERYSARIIDGILDQDRSELYRLYVNSEKALPFDLERHANARQVSIPFPRLWTHLRLSVELLRNKVDALFIPSHVVPPVHPRATVVTIHDLGYLYEPEAHPAWARRYLDWSTRWSALAARKVIAISEVTRRDLIERYHVRPEKIVVIPHGIDERFTPDVSLSMTQQSELTRLGIRSPYLLFLGTIQPRKNLVRLIQAFNRIADARPDLSLVLAGGIGWLSESIVAEAEQSPCRSRILLTGHVADDLLPMLFQNAQAAVFPSLYEGFGIPAAEAMASGTPVVASNRGALPEVVGEAGVLVDPFDVDSIVAGIREALDQLTRTRRIEAGLQRAERFNWHTAAERTLEVIHEAIESSGKVR